MTKELIERLRKWEEIPESDDAAFRFLMRLTDEAADLIEQQQKRIELYEQALKASWPEGAIGDAFDYWNAARKEDV